MITKAELIELTRFVDDLPVECDGATRILHLVLTQRRIKHDSFSGPLPNGIPHCWIEVDTVDGHFAVDYRLRMWLGADQPHGVFDRSAAPYPVWPLDFFMNIYGCVALAVSLGVEIK